MHALGLKWLLIAAGLMYFAQSASSVAQVGETRTQNDQAEKLRPAPNAPKPAPEVRSNPAGPGERADICQELVAFAQKMVADPAKSQAAPPSRSEGSKPAGDPSQQRSGISGPVPHDDAGSATPRLSVEQAQAFAQAHDLRGCRDTVRQMRRAGVAMPPGLLALAALREDLLLNASPQQSPQ